MRLGIILLLFTLLLPRIAYATVGDVVASYTFEDGQVPNPTAPAWTQNAVPAQVLLENGNHFLRLTATPTDCGPAFNTTCPTVREELHVADVAWQNADSNPSTFCTKIRIPSFNPSTGDNLAQIYFYSGVNPIPGTWAVVLWDHLGVGTRPANLDPDYHFPNFQDDQWHDVCLTVFFSYTNGWVDVYYDSVFQLRLNPPNTIYVSGTPPLAQLWVNVYGSGGTADFDDIRVIKGPFGAIPPPTSTVTSIAPSTIDLASPPATVTVTGTGLGDQGFGMPYVNFYTVPGDVRLLDAPAISGTSTTLTQTFNPALFTTPGTYKAKVWLPPTDGVNWTLAGSINFTVTGAVPPPTLPITWSNDRGGSGTATGSLSSWTVPDIPLLAGINNITTTITNQSNGAQGTDTLAVTFAPPFPGNSLVGAWGFEEGGGPSTVDSSGNSNSGTLVNGPAWTVNGKFGKAIQLDGFNDRIEVHDSNSLDLTQSFTLSAWVQPSGVMIDSRALVVKNYQQFLYASVGSSSQCSASGSVMGGAVFNGTSGPAVGLCNAASTPPANAPLQVGVWTHLAVSYDGATIRLYRNGALIASQAQTGYMEPSTGALYIGASQFVENLPAIVDEVRVYNYAIPLTAGSNNTSPGAACVFGNPLDTAQQSIVRDMNCPVIQTTGGGGTLKIPASANALKLGASAVLGFGASP